MSSRYWPIGLVGKIRTWSKVLSLASPMLIAASERADGALVAQDGRVVARDVLVDFGRSDLDDSLVTFGVVVR